ncbi:MAG: glycosyltransferase family 9 protein [Candidatus Latescibacterota bacterium]|nr:MAG: glycosyltransferase family 9 protein [Candidatus Latescibacterota bacterium]
MGERRVRTIEASSVAVVRTDRLGDLLLSTPLFQAIKEASPDCRVIAVAAAYALPALEGNPHVDEILPWEADGGTARALAARRPDAAIVLNPSFGSCRAVRSAGIRFRTGPLSQPSSFLYLNRGIRQGRSRAGKHQSELDAAFAPLVTGGRARGTPAPFLRVNGAERDAGAEILRRAGAWEERPLAGLHAGSGDSALVWPEASYAELGRLLLGSGWKLVLTGTGGEKPLAERLAASIGPGTFIVAGDHPLRDFFGIISHLNLFVAPSTGPLHAAAALGVPVASPFPPLPSQSPARWGPRGAVTAVLAPPVACPARIRCIGRRCRHHPCMELVRPEDLSRAILALPRGRREET